MGEHGGTLVSDEHRACGNIRRGSAPLFIREIDGLRMVKVVDGAVVPFSDGR